MFGSEQRKHIEETTATLGQRQAEHPSGGSLSDASFDVSLALGDEPSPPGGLQHCTDSSVVDIPRSRHVEAGAMKARQADARPIAQEDDYQEVMAATEILRLLRCGIAYERQPHSDINTPRQAGYYHRNPEANNAPYYDQNTAETQLWRPPTERLI